MEKFTEEFKSDLEDIINDTSKNGGFNKLYEFIELCLNSYSEKRILDIKRTLKFVNPDLSNEIDKYDILKVIYEYSKLE